MRAIKKEFVDSVAAACDLSKREARQEIMSAAKYLRELQDLRDLVLDDIDEALYDMGVEPDFAEDLLEMI